MGALLAFALGHWRLAAALVLAAVLGLYIGYLRHEVASWEGRYAGAEQAVGERTAERDQALAAAKTCADATAKLVADAATRQKAASSALAAVQARVVAAQSEASRLRARGHAGVAPAASCPAGDALRVVREGLK